MNWRVNITITIIIIFIFFNEIGLPSGLQYTALLAPFFFLKFFLKYWKAFAIFLGISLIYLFVHLFNKEVTWFYYGRSFVLHFLVFIQVVAFYHIVNHRGYLIKKAFDISVYINLLLILIGVLLLLFGFPDFMFEVTHVSTSVGVLPRFRIFTEEPSYYSMLIAPIFLFYLTRYVDNTKRIDYEKIGILIVCFIASFSFGIISSILISMFIVYFLRLKNLKDKKRRNLIFSLVGFVVVVIGLTYLFIPENPIFIRFSDIISGQDSSGKGRVTEPWLLSFEMLKLNNDYWFGIGWGQIRTLGDEVIRSFYMYTETPANKFGLPNVLTEITTLFGFVGLAIFLTIQLVFYKVTKVYKSHFRSLIFWFIFIYQFTGSYSSNVLYYCCFVLAFSPEFENQNLNKPSVTPIKKE
jgi:hypothetical protein